MNYTEKFKNSLNKLKLDGRYRFFNEIERKAGKHPIALWSNNSSKSEIIVWCSNDYLGMSQNQLVTNSMIKAVENMGTGSGGTRNISGNSSAIVNLEKVMKVSSHINGEYYLTLTCGSSLKMSRSYKDKVKHFS